MFIVCKKRADGTLVAGTPPTVHRGRIEALNEAAHLAEQNDGVAYIVFEAITISERERPPVVTRILPIAN